MAADLSQSEESKTAEMSADLALFCGSHSDLPTKAKGITQRCEHPGGRILEADCHNPQVCIPSGDLSLNPQFVNSAPCTLHLHADVHQAVHDVMWPTRSSCPPTRQHCHCWGQNMWSHPSPLPLSHTLYLISAKTVGSTFETHPEFKLFSPPWPPPHWSSHCHLLPGDQSGFLGGSLLLPLASLQSSQHSFRVIW